MRRGSLQSKFVAATGCLAAALAFGVTACGGGDSGDSSSNSSGGGGQSATRCSSVPLPGASRENTGDLAKGAKLALAPAGGQGRGITGKDAPPQGSPAP